MYVYLLILREFWAFISGNLETNLFVSEIDFVLFCSLTALKYFLVALQGWRVNGILICNACRLIELRYQDISMQKINFWNNSQICHLFWKLGSYMAYNWWGGGKKPLTSSMGLMIYRTYIVLYYIQVLILSLEFLYICTAIFYYCACNNCRISL